jgi:hypothetical protein
MGVLKDKLSVPERRPQIIEDCARLVDGEVAAKTGVTGIVIKTGYKAFKALKPTIVKEAVDHLLDDFATVLDRHHESYLAAEPERRTPFDAWAKKRDSVIADDLLKITDGMMDRSSKTAIKKIYKSLRNVAQRNVAEAVPAIGRLVIKHVAQ